MFEEKKKGYLLRSKAEFNITGVILIIVAIPFLITLLIAARFVGKQEFYITLLIPVIFVLIGLVFMAIGRKTFIDTHLKNVKIGSKNIPFSEIGGIQVLSRIDTHMSNRQNHEILVWQILIATKKYTRRLNDFAAGFSELLEDSGRNELSKDRQEKLEELLEEQADYIDENIGTNLLFLTESPNELKVWQITEKLARLFNVPIVDGSNELLEIREVEELDLTFVQKIKMDKVEEPENVPKPDTVREHEAGAKKSLSWDQMNYNLIGAGSALLFVFGLALIVVILAGAWKFIIVSLIPTVIGGILLGLGIVKKEYFLELDLQEKKVKRLVGKNRKCFQEMSLDELESVRVYRKPDPCITLMSDKNLMTIETDIENAFFIYKWLYESLK